MQKVQLPISLGDKPSIHSLLLSQDQVKNPYKDEFFSSGWSFPSTSSYYTQQNSNIINSNNSRNSYIQESKKFKFSHDNSSSDESDNGEYYDSSPKQYQKLGSNGNMTKLLNNQSLPTFKQFQSQLDVKPSIQPQQQPSPTPPTASFQNILSSSSSSSSLHSSPSSASSSPSYSVPTVTLQQQEISNDFRSPFEQPHSPSSYPSSPLAELVKNKQIQQWIQELHQIKKREYILLENLKYYTTNSYSSSDESDEDYESTTTYQQQQQQPPIQQLPQPPSPSPKPQQPIQQPIQQPTQQQTQQQLLQLVQQQQLQMAQQPTITLTATSSTNQMVIQQQPSESIVCNRYIHPAIVVVVDQEVINQTSGYLIVNASLVQQNSKTNFNTNKNQLLQGVKSILVEKNGIIIFNKLKLSEMASKFSSQLFSICFTLSDISSVDKQSHIISQISTTPFYIVSKPNKRKSDEIESSDEPSSPLSQKINSPPSSPSLTVSNNTTTNSKMEDNSVTTASTDPNYIDITDLLILPQKEAASLLGISESMLCKRFKECTRRKWPYRYLRKIDKFIKLLSLQNANEIPKEEKEKLEKYILEREECLRPVKIRITGCLEKDDSDHFVNNTNKFSIGTSSTASLTSSTPTPSKSQIQNLINNGNDEIITSFTNNNITNNTIQSNQTKFFENFTTGGEGKGLENLLETLEMLKHTRQ